MAIWQDLVDDHGLATTLAAVCLGASFIERHITLDRAMWGTDQAASVEPRGFERLVQYMARGTRTISNDWDAAIGRLKAFVE